MPPERSARAGRPADIAGLLDRAAMALILAGMTEEQLAGLARKTSGVHDGAPARTRDEQARMPGVRPPAGQAQEETQGTPGAGSPHLVTCGRGYRAGDQREGLSRPRRR
jgi:hypothetical protein